MQVKPSQQEIRHTALTNRPRSPNSAGLRRRLFVGQTAECAKKANQIHLCLNQVEIWLGTITRDCLRRKIFRSIRDLVNEILRCVRPCSRNVQLFRWTYHNLKGYIYASSISERHH
jgi:hypothetical protein